MLVNALEKSRLNRNMLFSEPQGFFVIIYLVLVVFDYSQRYKFNT